MKKVIAIVLAFFALGTMTGCSQMNRRELTIHVTDKERVCDANGWESCCQEKFRR